MQDRPAPDVITRRAPYAKAPGKKGKKIKKGNKGEHSVGTDSVVSGICTGLLGGIVCVCGWVGGCVCVRVRGSVPKHLRGVAAKEDDGDTCKAHVTWLISGGAFPLVEALHYNMEPSVVVPVVGEVTCHVGPFLQDSSREYRAPGGTYNAITDSVVSVAFFVGDPAFAYNFDPLSNGIRRYPCMDAFQRPGLVEDTLSCLYNNVYLGETAYVFIPAFRSHSLSSGTARACFILSENECCY